MFDPDPIRPPPWRNLTAIGVGVVMALVLAFGLGLVVGRAPRPPATVPPEIANQAAATILPNASTIPAPPPAQTPPPTATTPPAAPAPPPQAILPAMTAPKPAPAKPPVAVAATPPSETRPKKPPLPEVVAQTPVAPPIHRAKQSEPEIASRKIPLPAPEAKPAETGSWVIQVGAFRSSEHASLLVQGLATHGRHAVEKQIADAKGSLWYVVQLEGFATRASAQMAADALKATEHLPVLIRREP